MSDLSGASQNVLCVHTVGYIWNCSRFVLLFTLSYGAKLQIASYWTLSYGHGGRILLELGYTGKIRCKPHEKMSKFMCILANASAVFAIKIAFMGSLGELPFRINPTVLWRPIVKYSSSTICALQGSSHLHTQKYIWIKTSSCGEFRQNNIRGLQLE